MNQKNTYHVLGVMSGTSLDGIDLAECEFSISQSGIWAYRILKAVTIPYTVSWQRKLKDAIYFSEGRLTAINEDYTFYLADVISNFIESEQLKGLDAICSHGHTILHQPERGRTLQIGNLKILSERLNQKVVCDFRVQDVELGGQGAPLVPVGDRLLFSEYDYCLNLGGFANISYERHGKRIAYDICPVNIVLNSFAMEKGKEYDSGGELARSGKVSEELLERLNALPFYLKNPPKSLGLEWVQENIFPVFERSLETPENKLATFTEHVALQLSDQFEPDASILATGGGAYNIFLLERLKQHNNLQLVIPSNLLIEYKEALVFALLGVLRLRGQNNCLASVTGAKTDHSSGRIFLP